MSSELERNPFIAVGYLKRAYLISAGNDIKGKLDLNIKCLLENVNLDKDLKKEINLILRQ